jgi:hypothetical protein
VRGWGIATQAAVIGAIAALMGAAFGWIYAGGLTYDHAPPIRSDGVGYYVYLPAAFLDHDLTMRRTASRSFGGDPTRIPGVRWVHDRSGKRLPIDQYGIGTAVMIAPFFAAGHLIAVADGASEDGFSWPYQAAAAAAGAVYALLGLALLWRLLARFFEPSVVAVTIVAITFGAAVFQYATYDATFSHAFSFCLIALVLLLSLEVWQRPRAASAATLGATLGLVGLVRLTNLVAVLLPALIGVRHVRDLRPRLRVLLRRLDLLALGAGAFVIVLIPQLAYWQKITGRTFINSYHHEGQYLDLLDPHLYGVLFSVRKGLFVWTPLVLLAVVGLPLLRRAIPALFVPAIAYLAVQTWVVASWSVWSYGGSFGMRALIEAMPVLALGLAALIQQARSAWPRRAVTAALALTTLLAVHGIVAYWLQAIPPDHATWRDYAESFWRY